MKRSFAAVYWIMALLLLTGISESQVVTGIQPFGSYGGGPFDTVNLGNLNVHFSVPIRHKTGRGVPFLYDLSYDNSIWQIVTSGSNKSWQPVHTVGSFGSYWGWQGLGPVVSPYVSYTVQVNNGTCFNGSMPVSYTQWNWSAFTYHDAQGRSHLTGGTAAYIQSPGGAQCPPNGPQPTTAKSYLASDGSGYVNLNVATAGSITGSVTAGDGSAISAPFLSTPPTSPSPFTTTDRNGNEITETNAVYTDTLGTTVLTVVGTQPSNTTFTYMAPNQQNVSYTASYVSKTVQTAFNCSGITDFPATAANLVSTIQLPDGTSYQFTYEPTSVGSGNTTGRILSVTLPTGGKITYTYGALNCADGSVQSLTRQLDSSSPWQYSRAQTGSDSHWQTTITDPTSAANQTVIDFESSFYETQRAVHQGSISGAVLSHTITCYNTPDPTASTCPTTAVAAPISRRTVFTYMPDTTGVAAETDTEYQNGDPTRPIEIDSYDFGAKNAGVGPLTRKVINNFNYILHGIGSVAISTGQTIEDGNGNVKAQTTYTYDQNSVQSTSGTPQLVNVGSASARGNMTTLATEVSGSVTLYRRFTYYDTGNLINATDAGTTTSGGSNLTAYSYAGSSCGNSFLTSISEPLSLARSFGWDCNGGVMTSATDENGATASVLYTQTGNSLGSPDPDFWRPFGAEDQLNNGTSFTYPSAIASESSMLFNGSTSVVDRRTTTDDFGRPIVTQTLQAPGGTTYDSVETSYDVVGRVGEVLRPYAAGAGAPCSGTCPGTTTSYDPLNRPTTVTDGGGGTINYTYNFNDVLQVVGPHPSGENTKQKQLEYDGLGRLKSVCEVSGASGSGACGQNNSQTGFWTKYTYDLLGDLTGVTQNAQAASGSQQARTYTFDMAGRLLTESNPETGGVTYVYDAWDSACGSYSSPGDLVEKKDALGNVTCMKYDGLHRATQITYPSGSYASVTRTKCFVYDSAIVNSLSMTDAKTRLAEAYTTTATSCPSSTKIVDEGFSYDARGEVADVYESTPNSGGYYHVNATYWANGNLDVLNGASTPLPGLPAITYGASDGSGLDGEGRITKVSAASGQNPVTSVGYNVSQQVTGVTFGSVDSDAYQYDGNTGRMLKYTFNMGTGPTKQVGTLTWNQNGTLGQLQIADQINTANSQTCTFGYDDLVRITNANCGSVWAQTFGFDPFGNLSKTGSAQFLPTYTGASGAGAPTNQYYQISGGAAGTSNYYDTNGNLKNDVTHSYTWDSDGNTLSTDGTTVTMIYDALDRMIEQSRGSTHTQIVYGPNGMKLALMNGQALINAFVKLPGGARAVYSSSGLAYYRHADHLGSSRLATTPTRTKYYDMAYAPYGEDYNGSGTQDLAFTDENQDTVSGGWSTNLYDFMMREYRTAHGRWASPDPTGLGAVDPTNPQSWNRYAYVLNNPLAMVDLLGDDGCYDANGMQVNVVAEICGAAGGTWLSNGLFVGTDGNVYQQGQTSSYDPGNGTFGFSITTTLVGPFGTGEAAIVEEPGDPGGNIDQQVANNNSNSLSQAVNKTGVQNLKNPCTTVAWLAGSAIVGAAGSGVAGSEAVQDAAYDGAFWLYQKAINAVWKGLPPGEGIVTAIMFYGKAALSGCNAMAGK